MNTYDPWGPPIRSEPPYYPPPPEPSGPPVATKPRLSLRGKWAAAVAAGVALLAIGGALGGSHSTSSSSVSSSTVDAPLTGEHAYLAIMQDHFKPRVVHDDVLLATGHSICGALDRGASVDGVVEASMTSGLSATDIGFTIGTATATICPSHLAEVNAWSKAHGAG
jgi:hypothetical protein